eukprot:6227006-Prymnesium_polylepis.9
MNSFSGYTSCPERDDRACHDGKKHAPALGANRRAEDQDDLRNQRNKHGDLRELRQLVVVGIGVGRQRHVHTVAHELRAGEIERNLE